MIIVLYCIILQPFVHQISDYSISDWAVQLAIKSSLLFILWKNAYMYFMISIFTCQGKVPLTKVGTLSKSLVGDALVVTFLLSANQSERSFQSEFGGYTIFTFHLNKEHVLFMQWEILCNWFQCLWNQSNRSPTFSFDFCQRIV